jgi:anti-sigma factor RsiW
MNKHEFWPFRSKSENPCREIRESALHLVDNDGDAPPGILDRIRRHIEGCEACAAFIRTLQATVGIIRRVPPQTATAELRERLRGIADGRDP